MSQQHPSAPTHDHGPIIAVLPDPAGRPGGAAPIAPGRSPGGPPGRPPGGDDRPSARSIELALVKNGQRFVFRYTPGDEAQAMNAAADLARNHPRNFSFFDALLMCHQMGRRVQAPWRVRPRGLRLANYDDQHPDPAA